MDDKLIKKFEEAMATAAFGEAGDLETAKKNHEGKTQDIAGHNRKGIKHKCLQACP
ncbi:MAG: hypothetical protein AB1797_11920 [bacterium]